MLNNLEEYATVVLIATAILSVAYFVDSIVPLQLDSSEDLLYASDTVPEISEKQSEPSSNPIDNVETLSTLPEEHHTFNYKHDFWPSPRPVNFVRALVRAERLHINGRISHGKAMEILAKRAQISPDVFLNTDPITYMKSFLPSHYTPVMLIGSHSISSLEDKIRKHRYLDILRRHG